MTNSLYEMIYKRIAAYLIDTIIVACILFWLVVIKLFFTGLPVVTPLKADFMLYFFGIIRIIGEYTPVFLIDIWAIIPSIIKMIIFVPILTLLEYIIWWLEYIYTNLPAIIPVIMMHWAYYALMLTSRNKATIGMIIMEIVMVDTKGRQLDIIEATHRHFAHYLSYLTLGLGFLWLIFDKKHAALHDNLSKTFVIKAEAKKPAVKKAKSKKSAVGRAKK